MQYKTGSYEYSSSINRSAVDGCGRRPAPADAWTSRDRWVGIQQSVQLHRIERPQVALRSAGASRVECDTGSRQAGAESVTHVQPGSRPRLVECVLRGPQPSK